MWSSPTPPPPHFNYEHAAPTCFCHFLLGKETQGFTVNHPSWVQEVTSLPPSLSLSPSSLLLLLYSMYTLQTTTTTKKEKKKRRKKQKTNPWLHVYDTMTLLEAAFLNLFITARPSCSSLTPSIRITPTPASSMSRSILNSP